MSSRTLQGAQAVQLAEAGMEDAIWAYNKSDWSTWTISGTTATKTLSGFAFDGNVTGQASLTITNYNGSGGTRTITAVGTTQSANGVTVSRTLTATAAKAPLFVNAVAGTTGRVRFQSAGLVDSYDSSLGTYASQTPTYSAVVSSGSTSTSSATVQMGNVDIKGYVATLSTGPSYSSSGYLIGPTTPGTTKIDTSRLSTSPYQPVFDVDSAAISGTSTLLPTGTATIGTAGASTPELYHATDVILSGTEVLTVDGPVILNVSSDISISNSAKIRITTNGSLQITISGASGDLTLGGYGIQNDTLRPKNLAIIARDVTNDTYAYQANTSTPFYGVIYAPLTTITISYNQTMYGSIVAKAVTFSASPNFHYDLSLRNETFSVIDTPYAVSNWRETTPGS